MREIKFRAWGKVSKILYPYITLYAQDFRHIQVNENGDDKLIDEDDYILMQYTGLKDKNGKEIYEGDIVTRRWFGLKNFPNPKLEGKIVQTDKVFWCEDNHYFSFGENTNLGIYEFTEDKLEVIGNIYENKELIK